VNENLNRSSPLENLVIGIVVALMAAVWFILLGSQIYFYEPRPVTKEEIMAMGHLDNNHTELVSKIRTDLKIPEEMEIKIFIGPYFHIFGYAVHMFFVDHPEHLIFIGENFYNKMDVDERVAVVSHELGHLTNKPDPPGWIPDEIFIQHQIEADTYATKYVEPEALIRVLNKTVPLFDKEFPEYKRRIENLKNIQAERNRR